MTNEKLEHLKDVVNSLTPEQLEKIGGGTDTCTPSQITQIINDLQRNYDTLVDFTSYVIERVTAQ